MEYLLTKFGENPFSRCQDIHNTRNMKRKRGGESIGVPHVELYTHLLAESIYQCNFMQ